MICILRSIYSGGDFFRHCVNKRRRHREGDHLCPILLKCPRIQAAPVTITQTNLFQVWKENKSKQKVWNHNRTTGSPLLRGVFILFSILVSGPSGHSAPRWRALFFHTESPFYRSTSRLRNAETTGSTLTHRSRKPFNWTSLFPFGMKIMNKKDLQNIFPQEVPANVSQ